LKESKRKKLSASAKLSNATQIPFDMSGCNPYIRMCYNREIIIEDAGKLMQYSEDFVKVSQRKTAVCISGKNLKISYLSSGDMRVTGFISDVGFE
jgi:sporulation protein YqfC